MGVKTNRMPPMNESPYSYEEDDVPLSAIKMSYLPPNPELRNQPPPKIKNKLQSNSKVKTNSNYAPSPPILYHASDPTSNRSSTTVLSNSLVSSNRSSSTYQVSDVGSNYRRSGRGTPSSESTHTEPSPKVSLGLTQVKESTAASMVNVSTEVKSETTKSNTKKKGFSFFSFFKRNKKKDSTPPSNNSVDQITSTPEPVDTRTAAEIRTEELKKMHENEFAKLRRQREKERSLSFYDMLPNSPNMNQSYQQQQYNEGYRQSPTPSFHSQSTMSSSRNKSYPSNLSSPPTQSSNRARSASTTQLPLSNQNNRPMSNYLKSTTSYELGPPSRTSYYGNHVAGYASSDALGGHRSIAPSPLIPNQNNGGRSSFYAGQGGYFGYQPHSNYQNYQQHLHQQGYHQGHINHYPSPHQHYSSPNQNKYHPNYYPSPGRSSQNSYRN